MSLLDRVRPSRTSRAEGEALPDVPRWEPALTGALAAAGSWLVLVLPAVIVWLVTPRTTVAFGEAVGVASAVWFLGHGSPVSVGAMSISVVPLGLWALAVVVTTRGMGRMLTRTEAAARGTTWPSLLGRRHLPGFAAGYAGFALVALLLTLAGPARPGLLGVVVALTLPVVATAICLVRRHAAGEASPYVGDWLGRLPRWVERAIAPGVWGSATLLLLGTLLVAVMVVARISTVTGLYAALAAGLLGALALTLAQLLLLPNLAIWALAWVAGPGFSVADGSAITLSGARPGLLPMIPVLGALPSDGAWSRWLLLVLALPVAVGFGVSHRACGQIARLASWRTKLVTSLASVAVSAVVIAVLTALSTGSAGVDRLRFVGPDPLALAAALLGELVVGALLQVGVDQVRQRRG
jgi:hypothetical protein